ncbi:hypothetical protein AAL_02310 [Moelleriella libera RCEF 2490]|uniref:Uncharacterized protein n=1 Tax=Moelleriella libera RCEF 2490 TaxID=1081109 RepID=A0A168FD14_9HYPO|nr:hypothetical protein AAL_02310 [Moelleriella libera RCEF 2490]
MPDLAEWVRTRAERVKDPSPRDPTRETRLNDADNIERQMRQDGHRTWGWLIYRCTYASDEQWAAFMARLAHYMDATLAFHNGLDLKPSLDARVVEDPAAFDGAVPGTVRQHFRQWAATASETEQAGRPALRSQRYRYCLHVDQAALESVVNAPAPPGDELGGGYVNLVFVNPSSADSTGLDPAADAYWMRITYADLMVTWYNLFRPEGAWETEYRQPPQIGRP